MAIFYTDLALRQKIGGNFPGEPSRQQITSLPAATPGQTNALFEGPPQIIATYTIVGTEAAGDIINIGVLNEGVVVDPNGKVSSGVTAPGTTLTVAIGDNDLADPSVLPLANPVGYAAYNLPVIQTAPAWVSGTTYAAGNVVRDTAASSGVFVSGDVYMAVAATSGATAPHSTATTVWMPIYQRYSATINVAGASSNVAFAGGTQLYGGAASMLPYSVVPGQAALGLTTNEILNQQYQVQKDCWLQARVLTASTLTAGTFLTFRVPIITAN